MLTFLKDAEGKFSHILNVNGEKYEVWQFEAGETMEEPFFRLFHLHDGGKTWIGTSALKAYFNNYYAVPVKENQPQGIVRGFDGYEDSQVYLINLYTEYLETQFELAFGAA